MAREAALKEVADRKLRRVLVSNRSPDRTDAKAGCSTLPYRVANRKSALGWRGPAVILDTDDAGEVPESKV